MSKGQFSLFFIFAIAIGFALALGLSTLVAQTIGFGIKHQIQVVVKAADVGKEVPAFLSVKSPDGSNMEMLGNRLAENYEQYWSDAQLRDSLDDIDGNYIAVSYEGKDIIVAGRPFEAFKIKIPAPGARDQPRAEMTLG